MSYKYRCYGLLINEQRELDRLKKCLLIFMLMNTITFTIPFDMINLICMRYFQMSYAIIERPIRNCVRKMTKFIDLNETNPSAYSTLDE